MFAKTGPNGDGQWDLQCKIKKTLLIRDLKPALHANVGCRFFSSLLFSLLPIPRFSCSLLKILSCFVTVTFEDACCSIRDVKFNIPCPNHFVMFVSAVCFLRYSLTFNFRSSNQKQLIFETNFIHGLVYQVFGLRTPSEEHKMSPGNRL